MTRCNESDDEWVEGENSDNPDADLLACPSCGSNVHEDTQQCPHCGDWITPVYPASAGKRWLFLMVVATMIVAVVLVAIR